MPRNPLQQRLISIVEPVCQAAGYELVDLRFVLEQGGWTLRVAVDRPLDAHVDPDEIPSDRVDLIACENLSRELSAVLDVEDPIPQAFQLEVSSPGIDRPLRTAEHFRRFAGSEVKIQLVAPLPLPGGDRRNFKGILQGVESDQVVGQVVDRVVIECDGTAFRLPLDDIDHARLVPDWDAVMRGKSGVGKPAPKPVKPGHRPSQKRRKGEPREGKPGHESSAAEAPSSARSRGSTNGPALPGQSGRSEAEAIEGIEGIEVQESQVRTEPPGAGPRDASGRSERIQVQEQVRTEPPGAGPRDARSPVVNGPASSSQRGRERPLPVTISNKEQG